MKDAAPTDLERAILAADDRRHRFMVSRDYPGLATLLAEELVYTHSNGTSDRKAAYLEPLQSGVLAYLRCERSDATVHAAGQGGAWLHGRLRMEISRNGVERSLDLRFVSVWVERGGTWQMAVCHTTGIAPPRPAA